MRATRGTSSAGEAPAVAQPRLSYRRIPQPGMATSFFRRRVVAAFALLAAAVATEEISLDVGEYRFGLATRGATAFRLRVAPKGEQVVETVMVDPDLKDAQFQKYTEGKETGIRSAIGSLAVTGTGVVILRDSTGKLLTQSEPFAGDKKLVLSSNGGKLYGRGAKPEDAQQFLATGEVTPMVCNTATNSPYYYSTDGYGALGATVVDNDDKINMKIHYIAEGQGVTWTWEKTYFELFLIPAVAISEGTRAYYELTGRPLMLPKLAYGFGMSRWGWEDSAYVENVVRQMRDGKFPIDYIIIDFEWFAGETDYSFQPPGKSTYDDFGWNPKLFDQPKQLLQEYREKYNIKMAGIRKPRIGNTETLNEIRPKGWILPNGEPGGGYPPQWDGSYAFDRCLDFSQEVVRDWYAGEMSHYTEDGVAFWWNDEGETNYMTYHYWNLAERQGFKSKAPAKRFFSLNRAFTPGMARLGAGVWTGDITANWDFLRKTPGMMLNFILGGAPYVACDIGGFNGESTDKLLTRWIQIGVFMPIMRVHSVISAKPHFPFLWGPEAAAAMREALELRYRLMPYHYSLAHKMYKTYNHYIRPVFFDFPDDEQCGDLATQWMFGDILVAPILAEDDARSIYLPKGTWYMLAAGAHASRTLVMEGGRHFSGTAALTEIPAFVRPGAVIPLAPVVQSTEELPGGPLEVEIYAGADGSFELIEDDGDTEAYASGNVRTTSLAWSNADRTLSWTVVGADGAEIPGAFVQVRAKLFDKEAGFVFDSGVKDLGSSGSITFDPAEALTV